MPPSSAVVREPSSSSASCSPGNEATPPPRPSVDLRPHHRANRPILSLDEGHLASSLAHHGGPGHDRGRRLRSAARSANELVRKHYADFIHGVGRNVYPLIVFTDAEEDGPAGVGSTLTLYRADGSVMRSSPALGSNYEVYKVCAHVFLGLAVEVGPYLTDGVDPNGVAEGVSQPNEVVGIDVNDVPWKSSMTEFVQRFRLLRKEIEALEIEAVLEGIDELAVAMASVGDSQKNSHGNASSSPDDHGLPPVDMRQTMLDMLTSAIDFSEWCLTTGSIDVRSWKALNRENFPRIKRCMKAATKAQADACVDQIIQWRDMLGPEEWRGLYVVIPTVWAVDGENPRKAMFRQLMDEDRIDTHIITSEYPRDHSEARMLLGRVAGDRALGRFVFGVETKEQRIKTMGLGSEVDVVQDDALPAIFDAVTNAGCPVRCRRSSSNASSTSSASNGSGRKGRPSLRPTFC